MVYDSDYDTDDTDELLAAKCSFQPTVVVCSTPQQKSLGRAASANEPAESCTIVEDEDWIFSISASSSRSASVGVYSLTTKSAVRNPLGTGLRTATKEELQCANKQLCTSIRY